MTSLTSTAQASTPSRRQGRSRAAVAYQSTIASPRSAAPSTSAQSAVRGGRRVDPGPPALRTTVPAVLHPVGPLPAAVYWRRRVLVLALVLSVVGGAAWLGLFLLRTPAGRGPVTAAATSPRTSPLPPSLDQ